MGQQKDKRVCYAEVPGIPISPRSVLPHATAMFLMEGNMIMDLDVQKLPNNRMRGKLSTFALLIAILIMAAAVGQSPMPALTRVEGTITLVNSKKNDPANVAIWLEPVGTTPKFTKQTVNPSIHQKGKKFVP